MHCFEGRRSISFVGKRLDLWEPLGARNHTNGDGENCREKGGSGGGRLSWRVRGNRFQLQRETAGRVSEWGDLLLAEGGTHRDRKVAGGGQQQTGALFSPFPAARA